MEIHQHSHTSIDTLDIPPRYVVHSPPNSNEISQMDDKSVKLVYKEEISQMGDKGEGFYNFITNDNTAVNDKRVKVVYKIKRVAGNWVDVDDSDDSYDPNDKSISTITYWKDAVDQDETVATASDDTVTGRTAKFAILTKKHGERVAVNPTRVSAIVENIRGDNIPDFTSIRINEDSDTTCLCVRESFDDVMERLERVSSVDE